MSSSTEIHVIHGRLSRVALTDAQKDKMRSLLADIRAETIADALDDKESDSSDAIEQLESLVTDSKLKDEVRPMVGKLKAECMYEVHTKEIQAGDPVANAAQRRTRFNRQSK